MKLSPFFPLMNRSNHIRRFVLSWLVVILLTSCTSIFLTSDIKVTIRADGVDHLVELASGKTIQDALDLAGIKIGNLDRVDPPIFTILSKTASVSIKRVREDYASEEKIIPFQQQTLKNESLPEKQTLIIQKGVNGKQQITYRLVLEDNVEVSRSIAKTVTLTEALPEIVMVGVQTPFTPVSIPGKLVYLTGNNAWKMEGSTSNRIPVATTGDLDGRIFSISPKGDYLLFTRKTQQDTTEGNINSLWFVDLTEKGALPVSLKLNNIIHYADWVPNKGLTIAYSTVEPRTTAPGWQANNDFHILAFSNTGTPNNKTDLINPNSGGIYGWWGSSFAFSPDGESLAYARPDGVGLVDIKTGKLTSLFGESPVQTRSDWAWVPGISWAYDHSILFTVAHQTKVGSSDEASPNFDLIPLFQRANNPSISLAPLAGMFAYPAASPIAVENHFFVAYLQAIFPDQSETSRYRLVVMDQDGSNRQILFPSEGSPGLEPQQVVWSPFGTDQASAWVGLVYQSNLWLVNPDSKQTQQVTGDGTITRLDWSKN
jgi:resuscitation-promoting factor RpfB